MRLRNAEMMTEKSIPRHKLLKWWEQFVICKEIAIIMRGVEGGGVKKRQLASTADGSGTQPRFPLHWNGLAVMNEPLPLAPLQGLRENSVSCRWLETLRKRDKYTIACLITFLVGTVENNGLIIPRTMPTTSGPLLTRGGCAAAEQDVLQQPLDYRDRCPPSLTLPPHPRETKQKHITVFFNAEFVFPLTTKTAFDQPPPSSAELPVNPMNNTRRGGSRNIRWKQRFSHPCPRPGFAFFFVYFYSEEAESCPSEVVQRSQLPLISDCFPQFWLIVYERKRKWWEDWLLLRGRWQNPFAFPLRWCVHTKLNECSGIARKATVAALNRNLIIFRAQTLYSCSVWCERSLGLSPSALCFQSFSWQHKPSWNTKRSFSLTGDFLWGLGSLWMTDNRAVSIGAGGHLMTADRCNTGHPRAS